MTYSGKGVSLLYCLLQESRGDIFVLPDASPNVGSGRYLVRTYQTNRLTVIRRLLQAGGRKHLVCPAIRLKTRNGETVVRTVRRKFLRVVGYLLRQRQKKSKILLCDIPNTGVYVRSTFLLRFTGIRGQIRVVRFFLRGSPSKVLPLFPRLIVPSNYLRFFIRGSEVSLLRLTLRRVIPGHRGRVQMTFRLKFRGQDFRTVCRLMGTLRNPLPPHAASRKLGHLYSTVIMRGCISGERVDHGVLSC